MRLARLRPLHQLVRLRQVAMESYSPSGAQDERQVPWLSHLCVSGALDLSIKYMLPVQIKLSRTEIKFNYLI